MNSHTKDKFFFGGIVCVFVIFTLIMAGSKSELAAPALYVLALGWVIYLCLLIVADIVLGERKRRRQ